MVIKFHCMMVKNDLGIVRLKEIGPEICVEYVTLKQLHVIKNISALVVRVVNWKHVVLRLIPNRIFFHKRRKKSRV